VVVTRAGSGLIAVEGAAWETGTERGWGVTGCGGVAGIVSGPFSWGWGGGVGGTWGGLGEREKRPVKVERRFFSASSR